MFHWPSDLQGFNGQDRLTWRLGVSFGELDCLGCFIGRGGLRLGGLECSLDWLVLGCFSGLCCFNELGSFF